MNPATRAAGQASRDGESTLAVAGMLVLAAVLGAALLLLGAQLGP